MAIDNTGISSLETGAPDIKYTGDEGPKDPRVMSEIDKIILQHWLQQGGTYGDVIPEEFKQQIIQMYGLDKMASVPEMAEGGIADIGFSKVQPSKDGSRPGYFTAQRRQERDLGSMRGAVGRDDTPDDTPKGDEGPKYEKPSHPHFDTGKEEPVYIVKDGIKHYRTGVDERGKPSTGYYDELEESEKEVAEQDINQDNVIDYKDRRLARQKKLLMGHKIYALKQKGVIPSKGIMDFNMWKSLLDPDDEWPEWAKSWKTDEGVPMTDAQILEEMNKIAVSGPYLSQQKSGWDTMKFKSGNELLDKIKSVESGEKKYHEVFGPQGGGGPGEGGPEYLPKRNPWMPGGTEDPDDPDDPDDSDPGDPATGPIDASGITSTYNLTGAGDMLGYLPTELASGVTSGTTFDPITGQLKFIGADGGRAGYASGGITDLRQGYFLGKLVKGILKPFKGITRGLKKFSKSKAGKLAIMAALGYGSGMFGSGAGSSWLKNIGTKLIGSKGVPGVPDMIGRPDSTGWLGKLLLKGGADKWSMKNISPWKSIGLMSMLPLLQGKEDDDMDMYKNWLAQKQAADKFWAPRFDPSNFRRIDFNAADGGRIRYSEGKNGKDDSMVGISMSIEERWKRILEILKQMEDVRSGKTTDPKYDPEDRAMGGRIGYAGGGYNDDDEEDHRMAALSAMYGLRRNAQEGGLMDLGGMEKDYRNEGGFVPIGGQERADDVPARLSKNEFVFTADAVRAAGGGDIDKGAEVMENVMENLEQGGQVSEESQGLEGARNMFATSQRLEGVL